MAMLPSHAHVECIVNGHRIITWGTADPPYVFSTDPSSVRMRGGAGRLFGRGEANHGGILTLHLAPHSTHVKWLMQQEIERKNRVRPGSDSRGFAQIYEGTLKDVVTQLDVSMRGGVIASIPAQTVAGQDFTVTFEFEDVTLNIEGADGAWSNFGDYPGANSAPSADSNNPIG